jgi:hypothetical protein
MNIARAFGGGPSVPWSIMEQYNAIEILEEVNKRGLDISNLEVSMASCDCCPRLVIETTLYKKLRTNDQQNQTNSYQDQTSTQANGTTSNP